MTHDPLFEATRALRELSDVESDAERFTRQKVLLDIRQRQRTKARRTIFAVPLAVFAIGSVAMAATRGHIPEPVRKWVAQVTGIESVAHERRAIVPRAMPSVSESPSDRLPEASGVSSAPEVPAAPIALAPEPSLPPAASPAPAASSGRGGPATADSPLTEAEFQRYRLAHEAHFIKKDPEAALALWNDYLAHAPSGRLAVEARYNQALCLLKLGRTREAKHALAPFVSGTYGAYRKQEAQSLIATINADAGL
jgi:TolA-binding protein